MKSNIFGDVRAEFDHAMLKHSFLEWQDYRILFESSDRFIVVGRRGTGKSALTYKLQREWRERKIHTMVIAPMEEQVIGLRPAASLFGDSVLRIRAGVKLIWRYAMLLEIGLILSEHYKTKGDISTHEVLLAHLRSWAKKGPDPIERTRHLLREVLKGTENPEDRIADLAGVLQLNRVTEDVTTLLRKHDQQVVILIDRLDEGYEPDTIGVGIVDGIIYGTDELRSALGDNVKALVFLRDNIFRAIQAEDQDFSRNLEAQVLRLHWDPQELFYMVTKRIRAALAVDKESDIKVWNAITSDQLHGRENFKRCLQLTLYRPRDVIALMNTAYDHARRQQRDTLINADFDASAKLISETRFDDLGKEYESVFPGIKQITRAFAHGPARMTVAEALEVISKVAGDASLDAKVVQHLRILGSPEEVTKALYGVGFLGVLDAKRGNFIFSHDGKNPDKAFLPNNDVMIHPCYWPALAVRKEELDQAATEEIFDEYEIVISSQSTEVRTKRLGQLIAELATIPVGTEGASAFEDWCKRAIEIAFAKELTNIQLRPNKLAT
jgi:hypothetical protein